MSPDGSAFYYALGHQNIADIWKVPFLPFEGVSLEGSGATYHQDFDEALGVNGKLRDVKLPTGWTTTENGVVFETSVNKQFPAGSSLGLDQAKVY
jgi:hypothetical protein